MYMCTCILYAYRSYIQNIGTEFCVQGCDRVRACKGYITFEDTKRGSYMQYIGPISILYTISSCMMVRSPAELPHQRDDVTIILYVLYNMFHLSICVI